MDRVPKTVPGSSPFVPGSSPPLFASTSPRNLRDMSVSELVAVLRPAFRAEDYDKVEEVLESKYAMLQEQVQMERLERIHLEKQLRKDKENYENLLKIMKEAGGLASGGNDSHCIEEMKKKIGELEAENFELKEKKLVDDHVGELRKKNVELVCENYEMKEMKEKRVDDSTALEEGWNGKKEFAKFNELRDESLKLEGISWREFEELRQQILRQVARMEDDIEGDSPAGHRANEEDIGDYELGNDTGGTMKRNEDTHQYLSLGCITAQSSNKGCKDAGGGIEKLENDDKVINLDDSDDHGDAKKALSGIRIKSDPPSSFVEVQKKSTLTKEIELLKRKLPFTVYSSRSSTGSASDEELDVDNLPLSFERNKRS